MLHLRAITPKDRTDEVCRILADDPGTTNVMVFPDAARRPPGDVVMCDVAREAANDVIAALRALGLERDGSIALERIDVSISAAADAAEERAPGHGDDAVVWEELDRRLAEETRLTWSFVAFLALATQLAGIAALIDSTILIVGAMVLGPEFGAVAAVSHGLLRGDGRRILRALGVLAAGFAVAVAVTFVCALVARWTGIIGPDALTAARPQTGFVYHPDRWSFIVAVLAGAAGVLSLTAGKSSALVGVFISVTTVPAAGNIAVAAALSRDGEIRGSAVQLGVNLLGMVLAGTATLAVQKAGWSLVRRRRRRT
ncbi:DUF389 domain-containing protein [Actinomadura rayongensis]|uniref:DUF389 domain-containing protein n=1 Tax=Actinomadura rayongensis TaxID=1429076 RepID=A0A6I4W4P0_9ACTN|nr:DUF389 domain-containing protein [Actinomadura rayongensis]MXQ64418.1 DUF389 domain-containing protein [Actinomadura rayongensis]